MSMIKYSRLTSRNILLELTKSRLPKKVKLSIKEKTAMSRIIQKIKLLPSRLNFFDAIVLLALLAVVVFFVYNRLQRQSTWVEVRLSVENADWWYRGSPPQYWYAKDLEVGDSLLDSFGQPVAEIINIDVYDNYGPYRDIYVDLKVRVDHDRKKNQYLYEFKPLVVGSALFFNFPSVQLRGLVVHLGEQQIEYFYKTIRLEKKKIDPNLAEKIQVGSKAYDAQGNVLAEIMAINSKINTYQEFSDLRGRNIEVYDPKFRDVEVVVKLKSSRDFGIDYFVNKAALKVGNGIWLQFPEFALDDMRIIELID